MADIELKYRLVSVLLGTQTDGTLGFISEPKDPTPEEIALHLDRMDPYFGERVLSLFLRLDEGEGENGDGNDQESE